MLRVIGAARLLLDPVVPGARGAMRLKFVLQKMDAVARLEIMRWRRDWEDTEREKKPSVDTTMSTGTPLRVGRDGVAGRLYGEYRHSALA